MTEGNGISSIVGETNALLRRLVSDELESVLLDKQRYDHKYPTHVKELSQSRLLKIARQKVLRRLCSPFCDTDGIDRSDDISREWARSTNLVDGNLDDMRSGRQFQHKTLLMGIINGY